MSNKKLNELEFCKTIVQGGKINKKIELRNESVIQSIPIKRKIVRSRIIKIDLEECKYENEKSRKVHISSDRKKK